MSSNFSTSQNKTQLEPVFLPASDPTGTVQFCDSVAAASSNQKGHLEAALAAEGALLVLNAGIVSPNVINADIGRFERIKHRFELQEIARSLMPGERVCKCLRWRFNAAFGVGVQYVELLQRAHYSNLQTCGLSWVCPVCAAKITERRRVELTQAVDYWRAAGESMFLATFTMRHNSGDLLGELLRDMSQAYRRMRGGDFWQRFEKKFSIVGSVAAHEITYGQASGFHPHKHVLFFVRGKITNLEKFELWFILTHRWQQKLAGFGRDASDLIGVDIQEGYGDISEYVAKWGLVEEVTKSNSKIARSSKKSEHYSPFQLLDLVGQGSSWAGPVFLDYARSTKGKNQLTWSPGLRDLFELSEELTDQEIVEKQEQKAVLLLTLCWPEWRQVLKAGLRAVLLEVASTGSVDLVYIFLESVGIRLAVRK